MKESMFELFLGLEVRERKLYRNQKLHLKVLLKIKCLKAVSRFSLSYREKQKQLNLNPLPLNIIFFRICFSILPRKFYNPVVSSRTNLCGPECD